MLDNDNTMTVKPSEKIQKIPTNEKDYHNLEDILKFVQKRVYWLALMSFILSGSEARIYRISSGNKLDGMIGS